MHITVSGKQIDTGSAFQTHAEDRLQDVVEKYFDHGIEAAVTVSRSGHLVRTTITVNAGRGVVVQSHSDGDTARLAFDAALDRIAKRLRRYKRRLTDHHQRERAQAKESALSAQRYIIAATDLEAIEEADDAGEPGDHPTVIAEMTKEIETLTVGEAVMRLDLADRNALVFRNAANGGVNVVYRRRDGNIGWIDPEAGGAG